MIWRGAAGDWAIAITALVALAISSGIGAFIGGSSKWLAASRLLAGGGLAMLVTAFVGHLIGTAV